MPVTAGTFSTSFYFLAQVRVLVGLQVHFSGFPTVPAAGAQQTFWKVTLMQPGC